MELGLGHELITGKNNRAVIAALDKEGLTKIADKIRHLATAAPAVVDATHNESMLKKQGKPIDQVRAYLARCWNKADSPESFKKLLLSDGYQIAKGHKVAVILTPTGDAVPLLRALNTGLKKEGRKPVKKAELEKIIKTDLIDYETLAARYEANSPKISNAISPEKQKTINKKAIDNLQRPYAIIEPSNKVKQQFKAKNTREYTPAWQQARARMMYEHYGSNVDSDLSQFWRIEVGQNGQVKLSNKLAILTDLGDRIGVGTYDSDSIEYASRAAIKLAKAKGWDSVRPNGSDEYKKSIYKIAEAEGLTVLISTDQDQKILDEVRGKSGARVQARPASLNLR